MNQVRATIAGTPVVLDQTTVERALAGVLPEPIADHYVVVDGRRYPPKQVIGMVVGLDRADFTTHQARRVLRRVGFTVGRRSEATPSSRHRRDDGTGPHGGQEADALRPYVGRWVAQRGLEVLVAADTPQDVLAWLERFDQEADAMFLVPVAESQAEAGLPG